MPEDEDPELREAMDRHLLDLCDDSDLVGKTVRVVEVTGPQDVRVARVLAALAEG